MYEPNDNQIRCPHCGEISNLTGLIGANTNFCPHCGQRCIYPYAYTIAKQDGEFEFQLRLQLRETLQKALDLLTNPESDESDANRIVALINQTLEDTAP